MLAVRSYRVARGTSGRPWRRDSRWGAGAPEFLAGVGGPGGQSAAQEAGRNGATARAKRYAHCGLEDMRAKSDGTRRLFRTSTQRAKFGSETGRARSYAQRRFVNISALEANILRTVRCHFVKLAKTLPSNVNVKTSQIYLEHVHNLIQREIK